MMIATISTLVKNKKQEYLFKDTGFAFALIQIWWFVAYIWESIWGPIVKLLKITPKKALIVINK